MAFLRFPQLLQEAVGNFKQHVYNLHSVLFINAASIFFGVQQAFANNHEVTPRGVSNSLPPFTKSRTLIGFLNNLLDALMKFAVPLAVVFLVYAGFLFIAARGNTEKLKTAKKAFGYGIVGTTVILGAWVILTIIKNLIDAL